MSGSLGEGPSPKKPKNETWEVYSDEDGKILTWHAYFMAAAVLAAKRSGVKTANGACIVNKNQIIVSIGYDKICHAEVNAILNKTCGTVDGCKMYVTSYPCNECAKLIIQSGIEEVIYLNGKENKYAKEMFTEAGVQDTHSNYTSDTIDLEGQPLEEQSEMEQLMANEHAMTMALLTAKRSKDPETQVGACITDENNVIIGAGYNGMPRIKDDSKSNDEVFSWERRQDSPERHKHDFVCHAEANAILNKNRCSVKGGKIYVKLFPCDNCAKLIVESGIKEVFYYSDEYYKKPYTIEAKRILQENKIPFNPFRGRPITIDLE